ncbi:MAG: hypothetical protein QOH41_1173 [Blastocatellia bacterium]|jgi:hypothetical protein|nr:hypothetical protein [Blastocatellia bacterium]
MDHKLILAIVAINLFMTPICCQTSQVKSDREKAELSGPVAKIKTESTIYILSDGYAKWVEGPERDLWSETEYDKSGKIVNQKTIPRYGDPASCRYEYKYDDKHRQIERFCADVPEKTLERYTYEDDRFGNWIKRVALVPDGSGFDPNGSCFEPSHTSTKRRNITIRWTRTVGACFAS